MNCKYTGLSQTTTKSTGTRLTLKTIQKMVRHQLSKDAAKRQNEDDKAIMGMINYAQHQMTCGDGTGGEITSHSIFCPERNKYDKEV